MVNATSEGTGEDQNRDGRKILPINPTLPERNLAYGVWLVLRCVLPNR